MLTESQNGSAIPKEMLSKIDQVLESHDNDFTQIVGILLEVQALHELHYVPEPVSYYLAEKLQMPVTIIFDCLSFYSQLSSEPRAKYPIQVCNSAACRVNDNAVLFDTLKRVLGIEIGETTYDGRFCIEPVTCFGACDLAPAVRINGEIYGHLDTPEKVEALLRKLF